MIAIDVTSTHFIEDLETEAANQWMIDNVGNLLHDDTYLTYGVGWRLEYQTMRWVMKFDNAVHASLFLLKWS